MSLNLDLEQEIVLNDSNEKIEKKYRINFNNIKRNKDIDEKTQIIVIHKKRKRNENMLLNDFLDVSDKGITISTKKKKFDIADQLNKLNLNSLEKKVKNSNNDNKNTQTNITELHCKSTSVDIFDEYNKFHSQETLANTIQKDYKVERMNNQIKELVNQREKNMNEKRKQIKEKSAYMGFSEIKDNFNKCFGDANKMIDTQDNLIIVNKNNAIDRNEMKDFFNKYINDQNVTCKLYELDKKVIATNTFTTEEDYLRFLAEYKGDELVLDNEENSNSENNKELDYDSNAEDNSNYDYPEEPKSHSDSNNSYHHSFDNVEPSDDEDAYYPKIENKYLSYIQGNKNAEKKLNKYYENEYDY